MAKSLPLASLQEGVQLSAPICDRDGRLLLGTGVVITTEFLEKLRERGVQDVLVDNADWHRLLAYGAQGKVREAPAAVAGVRSDESCRASESLDRVIGASLDVDLLPSEDPFSANVRSCGAEPYEAAQMNRTFAQHRKTVSEVGAMVEQMTQGRQASGHSTRRIVQDSLNVAARDMDLFVCMGINPALVENVFDHSSSVAALALAVGAKLGLDVDALRQLGAGCMLHDAGMMLIDQQVVTAKRRLEPHELAEIARHPVLAVDLLDRRMPDASVGVRMVVYQMHERCNGTGYPRGWTGSQMHRLAKIASAVDAYVGLISPRPDRHALMPYFAMKKMLEDVAAGLFDPSVVRALLYTTSLFPLGSYCELSNGCVAKVIRANDRNYDKPVVESYDVHTARRSPQILDLSQEDIRVSRPITELR